MKESIVSANQQVIHAFHCCAEQTREVELEASVVTLKHAASADDAGLINPLLKKSQQHQLSEKVSSQAVVKPCVFCYRLSRNHRSYIGPCCRWCVWQAAAAAAAVPQLHDVACTV